MAHHCIVFILSFWAVSCSLALAFQITPHTPHQTCRCQELQMMMQSSPQTTTSTIKNNDHNNNRRSFLTTCASLSLTLIVSPKNPALAESDSMPIATFALRRAGALPPSITNLPPRKNGIYVRFGEQLLYSNDGRRTPGKDVFVTFDFPADWLQLDRIMGGIQYVDQRNGDKLYVFKVAMPEGVEQLKDVPKDYFGDAIFNSAGDLVRTGNTVEEYKVLSSQMMGKKDQAETMDDSNNNNNNNNKDPPRRRFKVKYTTVTGNNFAVERKGLVDAYEVEGMIYMLMTGSNAVLFDKKGIERDTVEYIVDSFRVQPTYGV
mmetsp:Transcript_11122/g.20815  ORF Transcript_11122/g.20815 Transcript_11122/m.20815 type:complete len:318 (-) Transcript_11122:1303-2256(-)